MIELKPCPFCGGEAHTHDFSWHASQFAGHMFDKPYWQVICSECRAAIGDFDTRAEAIAAWNTRHEETCNVKELETIAQTLSMASWCSWGECSECGCLTPVDSTFCIHCGRKVER